MKREIKKFNMILSGVGGQGLITLLKIIGEATLLEEKRFRSSELHGLSQRGGSVRIHLRVGEAIHSPLISQGKADLILALESQEALSSLPFASNDSTFLINSYQTPTLGETASEEEVMEEVKKVSSRVKLIKASDICKEKLETGVVAGVFLLGFASSKGIIPVKSSSLLKGIERVLPEKYWDLNIKAFELGQNYS